MMCYVILKMFVCNQQDFNIINYIGICYILIKNYEEGLKFLLKIEFDDDKKCFSMIKNIGLCY